MKKILCPILILLSFFSWSPAQNSGIPGWFMDEMKEDIGIWLADNSAYQGENEPFDHYALEWNWGPGHNHVVGTLYGRIGEQKTAPFWHMIKYWDFKEQAPVFLQIGGGGTSGFGHIEHSADKLEHEMVQDFAYPDGSLARIGHRTKILSPSQHQGSSFDIDGQNNWKPRRTYVWNRQAAGPRIVSRVDSSDGKQIVLIQELEVQAPVSRVWEAYTTKAGWEAWAVPLAEVDLRPGGLIRTNYNPQANIGDEGTNTLHIVSYVPEKRLTLQAEVSPNWPEFMKEEADRMFNVIEFEEVTPGRTRIVSYGLGYQHSPKFISLLSFFIQGNEASLAQLIDYLEKSPSED